MHLLFGGLRRRDLDDILRDGQGRDDLGLLSGLRGRRTGGGAVGVVVLLEDLVDQSVPVEVGVGELGVGMRGRRM
ncbi:hypothetical protein BDZ91DRAFT_734403, partial [Kalaharituber pfeilii]